MRSSSLALVALVTAALPGTAHAQRVVADIRVGSGPVEGRVIVGDPVYRTPRTRVVIEARGHGRPLCREVAVVRFHGRRGWFHQRDYRAVTVWYDSDRDRYYDRNSGDRDGLREVIIYERGGRFYDDDRRHEDRYRNDYRGRVYDRDHDHDDDRDRYRDRHDDHDHDRH